MVRDIPTRGWHVVHPGVATCPLWWTLSNGQVAFFLYAMVKFGLDHMVAHILAFTKSELIYMAHYYCICQSSYITMVDGLSFIMEYSNYNIRFLNLMVSDGVKFMYTVGRRSGLDPATSPTMLSTITIEPLPKVLIDHEFDTYLLSNGFSDDGNGGSQPPPIRLFHITSCKCHT